MMFVFFFSLSLFFSRFLFSSFFPVVFCVCIVVSCHTTSRAELRRAHDIPSQCVVDSHFEGGEAGIVSSFKSATGAIFNNAKH